MNSRLLSIIRKEFIQITRDPRTLVLIVVMPIMQLFLLGYAATTDIKNISLAVWDESQSPQSRALLDAFRGANYFSIDYLAFSEEDYRKLIESGKIRAAPKGGTASTRAGFYASRSPSVKACGPGPKGRASSPPRRPGRRSGG